jgi:hypothetical protein
MKYLITILVAMFYCSTIHAQSTTDSSCMQYHKGKFNYIDTSGTLIRVVRRKHYQTEYNDSRNVWISLRITWLSDCEYLLEQIGTNSKAQRKFNHNISGVVISKTMGADGYEYTCACKDPSVPKQKGIMRSMNN